MRLLPHPGAPPPENDNARVEAGTVGDMERRWSPEYSATAAWQIGLSQQQLAAVVDHRRTRPNDTLPAPLQRDLGRTWQQFVREAR
jgi:hypothetical protein